MYLKLTKQESIAIKVLSTNETAIEVQCSVLMDSSAKRNKHYLAYWYLGESAQSTHVPWHTEPDLIQTIESSRVTHTEYLREPEGFSAGAYMVGYSAVPADAEPENNICATTFLSSFSDVEGQILRGPTLILDEAQVHPDSFKFQYELPEQYNPTRFENWFGVWQADTSYFDTPPLAWAQANQTGDHGIYTVEKCSMKAGRQYQLVYFMNGWNQDKTKLGRNAAGAILNFEAKS